MSIQLTGAEMLTWFYWKHMNAEKVLEELRDQDGDYGDLDDEERWRRVEKDAFFQIYINRAAFLVVGLGFFLSVPAVKPDMNVFLLCGVILVISVAIGFGFTKFAEWIARMKVKNIN